MEYTNKYDLPQSIVDAIKKQTYDVVPDQKLIPITSLINPPRIRQLSIRNADNIVEDISDNVWILLGSATHAILERAVSSSRLTEERLYETINGLCITGKPDLYESPAIQDYKVTSAWHLVYKDEEDKIWEQQLNCYAYLYRKAGFTVSSIRIIAILRDWSKSKAKQDKQYPQLPIAVINIPLWKIEEQLKYIQERIELHKTAINLPEKDLPICSEQERWAKPTVYAVYRNQNKTATKLFDDIKSASEFIKANLKPKDEYRIETRQGLDIRCTEYCSVAPFCKYWQENYKPKEEETNGSN